MILLSLCHSFISVFTVVTYTASGRRPAGPYEKGDAKVILGSYLGEVAVLRIGLYEGGRLNATLTPFLGEKIIKIGVPYVDFPVCPALHLAFNQGEVEHANAAFFLMNHGASPNDYVIPNADSSYGYPPALLYALGMGQTPRNSHAGFLQRLHQALPDFYNDSIIRIWALKSGNPPLIQIPLLNNFFDGLYILVTEFGASVNETDSNGVTPLHIACWQGDLFTASFLLKNYANRLAVDAKGRTPLHYAAMRGFAEIITLLLVYTPFDSKEMHLRVFKRNYLALKDNFNRTALMLAALNPPLNAAIRAVRREMTALKQLPQGRWNRPPLSVSINRSAYEPELDDSAETRGGWRYLFPQSAGSRELIKGRSDVDIVMASEVTPRSFMRDYFSTQRPVLITDQLMAQEKIWAHWRRADILARYGDLRVQAGEKLYVEPRAFSVSPARAASLREWVEECMPAFLASSDLASPAASPNTDCIWLAEASDASEQLRGVWEEDIRRSPLFQVCGAPSRPSHSDGFVNDSDKNSNAADGNVDGTKMDDGATTAAIVSHSHDDISEACAANGEANAQVCAIEELGVESAAIIGSGSDSNDTDSDSITCSETGESNCSGESDEIGDTSKPDRADPKVILSTSGSSQDPTLKSGEEAEVYEADETAGSERPSMSQTIHIEPTRRRGMDDEPMKMTAGPRLAGAPMHQHSASWNLLLVGRKRWFLVAPGQAINATGIDPESEAPSSWRVSPALSWFDEVLPTLRAKGIVYEVMQYAGEVMFVPHGWMHATLNDADSISISQEFCTIRNTNQRTQPLGPVIYGGRDKQRGLGEPITLEPSTKARRRQGMMEVNLDGIPKI